jgi:NADPH-dependent glutamate synthase beta subunit-like oxidoreductase/glutamate synthase domain-containing protein 3/ferredoxin
MAKNKTVRIPGVEDGVRVQSRTLEERIQAAVAQGARSLKIEARGQHGLGGRIWISGSEPVSIRITGSPGQRVGSMGVPGTSIEVLGEASDDTGWLNAGAEIVVHGNAGNGTCNAMAQGKVLVAGRIGARGMTMTKHNPRFAPPELWVLDSAGDYFAEFMAGGIAVICGVSPQDPDNVLGHRPCVGMVGGTIFFRGPHAGFSQADAKLVPIDDARWQWLLSNLKWFLKRIRRERLFEPLSRREEWQLITARSPMEKVGKKRRSMHEFSTQVWESELGKGGLIGDLTDIDRSTVPLITTGEMRRFVPVWENRKYMPPCQASCPTGIPVQERWRLIREGRVDEAVDLALAYTPFPATVCGYLCPNLCMEGCTRTRQRLKPVDVSLLGRASIQAHTPELPPLSGTRIAVIGGGPAGLSVAWQLRRMGHEAVVYDTAGTLGGKITSVIPESRIPREVILAELERIKSVLPHVHLQQPLSRQEFEQLTSDFDFVVIATGANVPRVIPVPGKERLVPALDFLKKAKTGGIEVGARVVIIGAGNVGCDAATEAARLGAGDITLIDIQAPASFGKEREHAEQAGAKFRYPCFTREITEQGVVLTTGELIPADTVIISIGDLPGLEFLSEDIATERGFVLVNELFQTTNPRVFAIGDAVRPGLITDAIGSGRKASRAIDAISGGLRPSGDTHGLVSEFKSTIEFYDRDNAPRIDMSRIRLEYFDPRIEPFETIGACAGECSSCGSCRECGICANLCPQAAISKIGTGDDLKLVVDPERCIGCGYCAASCPCGIWTLQENTPIEEQP